jgi:SPOR domain
MSGSALMAPQVNLDEFERRLRAAGSPVGPQEDPLDELARLVGLDAPEPKPREKVLGFAPRAEAPRLPPVHPLHIDELANEAPETAPATMADAPLRGALDDSARALDFSSLAQDFDPQHFGRQGQIYSAAGDGEAAAAAGEAPRRSGRVLATMGVLVVVGAAGLVGAWVVKGAPGLPKTPPLIMAADGPTKIQPPTDDTIASPSDSASVLLKDQKGKPEPVKLVSSQEQPVDLAQQAKAPPVPAPAPMAAAVVAAAPPAGSSASSAPLAAASAMPAAAVSASPAPAAPSAGAAPGRSIAALSSIGSTSAAPAAPAPFPEPKRVKTVSVRPDGSVISSGSEVVADARPAADPAAAPATPDASSAPPDDAAAQPAHPPVPHARPAFDASADSAAQPATPKLDLPTKLSPKSSARVPIAKTDTTVASGAAQSAETPRAQPQQQAQQQAPQPQKSPLQLGSDIFQSVTKAVGGEPQTQVAAADPVATATTTTSSGSYAVQLAAPATDREAQSASARLQAKYASALGGMQPTIHQADVNGRSIYRVRVGGMAKADAVALCQKLKASGGDCFVARD